MTSPTTTQPAAQTEKMNRMYRFTRHVYNLSRRYYLFGRDQLIRQMAVELPAHAHVLEMGCGTARNLIKLAKQAPQMQLFGLDASSLMLETAQQSVRRHGLSQRIMLKTCLAEQMTPMGTFQHAQPFDAIFFSYSLSMIPTWEQAIEAALSALQPQGTIYIVDFWDQADLPDWFARLLKAWLRSFHVEFRPQLLERLRELEKAQRVKLTLISVKRRYAYIARLDKVDAVKD